MEAISINASTAKLKDNRKDLAAPMNYQTLFVLFLFGSVAGFFLEGVWHIFKTGTWESHSAVVWGPFCIIYGVGLLAVYLIALLLSRFGLLRQFTAFAVSGAVIEYFASLIQEIWLGSASWDYSDHFLNIDGRISLQMALFWGVLGLLFVCFLRSPLCCVLDRIRGKRLNYVCTILSIFMAINLLVTASALNRWKDRQNGKTAMTTIELAMDHWFNNATMTALFPNMTFIS